MKKMMVVFLAILCAATASAQRRERRERGERTLTEGFYVNLGAADGPTFASFIDYVNSYYGQRYFNTTDRLDKFGTSAAVSLGYLLRFYPSFALDVGFTIYSLKTKGQILNNNPAYPNEIGVRHDLEYQAGVFSATIPVLFDFSRHQPLVPYVGLGISIFAMRLDDIRDDGYFVIAARDTGTGVGGQFEVGSYIKLSRKFWVDLKGRWFKGSGNIRAQEPAGLYDSYKMDQDITMLSGGLVYFFR